ncbi:MAG TPA: nitroreductase family protein [Pseudomonadales bacterium]|nr:nitroreductase family protein [Pseudomonadales bacterium]
MELYDAMRTTFAARDYTHDPVTDEVLYRILEHARFAPSGGNRQGWRVLIIKDKAVRRQLKDLMQPTIKQYKAQAAAGETPFNSINPTRVAQETIDAMPANFPLIDSLEDAPVVLVVCIDLTAVTSFDKDLDRVGVISGASIYPFVWNILLAARNEGLGGVLTTFVANQEPNAKVLLGLPDHVAIASMVAIGKPVKQLTKLKRNKVETFTRLNTWDGDAFRASR